MDHVDLLSNAAPAAAFVMTRSGLCSVGGNMLARPVKWPVDFEGFASTIPLMNGTGSHRPVFSADEENKLHAKPTHTEPENPSLAQRNGIRYSSSPLFRRYQQTIPFYRILRTFVTRGYVSRICRSAGRAILVRL